MGECACVFVCLCVYVWVWVGVGVGVLVCMNGCVGGVCVYVFVQGTLTEGDG